MQFAGVGPGVTESESYLDEEPPVCLTSSLGYHKSSLSNTDSVLEQKRRHVGLALTLHPAGVAGVREDSP